jgi:hypothetical protein
MRSAIAENSRESMPEPLSRMLRTLLETQVKPTDIVSEEGVKMAGASKGLTPSDEGESKSLTRKQPSATGG